MDELVQEHACIEANIFQYSLQLLRPWYTQRRAKAAEIPNFWRNAIEKSELLGEQISYEDNEIFDSLRDLHIDWNLDDPRLFTISLKFDDNKYTEACELSKEFNAHTSVATDVPIPWKPRRNLLELANSDTFFKWFGETDEAAFEIAQTLAVEIFPHAHNYYNLDDDDLKEYDISESEDEGTSE